jgi:threonine dehydratase
LSEPPPGSRFRSPHAGDSRPVTPRYPTLADVFSAAWRLQGVARRTPLVHSPALSRAAGATVHLKLETLQETGSFKVRGAFNAIAALDPEVRSRGVVAASAGNHGQGVAFAAARFGISATVYVPAAAPDVQKHRITGFGATLHEVAGGYDETELEARAAALETGTPFVHAFSDPEVVAGQGTVGLEIAADLPEAGTLVVPVGGGGLIGGVGTVARALGSGVRVVGVQTEATRAMHDSLAAGVLRSPPIGETICEGLEGDVDARSLALARRVVDEMVLVPEAAVRHAVRWLYDEEGIVVEGSAAVAAAALLEGHLSGTAGPIAAVLSGRNVDGRRLAALLAE